MRRTISAATWAQLKTAHASGIGLRELARNMNLPEGTVLARAKREGWTRQLQNAKTAAAQPVSREPIVTPCDAAAVTMQQRGQRYLERMAGVSETVLPHLESMEPAAVLDGIHEIEKYDRMSRRTFGLTDGQQPTGPLNLSVLAQQASFNLAGQQPS